MDGEADGDGDGGPNRKRGLDRNHVETEEERERGGLKISRVDGGKETAEELGCVDTGKHGKDNNNNTSRSTGGRGDDRNLRTQDGGEPKRYVVSISPSTEGARVPSNLEVAKALEQYPKVQYDDLWAVGRRIQVATRYKTDYELLLGEKAEKLAGKGWKVEGRSTEVTCAGIIRGVGEGIEAEDIEWHGRGEDGQAIIRAEQQKRRDGSGNFILCDTFKVIFKGESLPRRIFMYGQSCRVSPYVLPVRQCSKCLLFGHLSGACRRSKERCANCGKEAHGNPRECKAPAYCPNCKGKHPATDPTCPSRAEEKAVKKVMAKQSISYRDAVKRRTENRGPQPQVRTQEGPHRTPKQDSRMHSAVDPAGEARKCMCNCTCSGRRADPPGAIQVPEAPRGILQALAEVIRHLLGNVGGVAGKTQVSPEDVMDILLTATISQRASSPPEKERTQKTTSGAGAPKTVPATPSSGGGFPRRIPPGVVQPEIERCQISFGPPERQQHADQEDWGHGGARWDVVQSGGPDAVDMECEVASQQTGGIS